MSHLPVVLAQSAEIWPGWPVVAALAGSLLVAGITTLSQKKTAMFYYGRLTEKVDGHEADIKELRQAKDDHETRISHIEGGKASGAAAGRFV